MAREQVMQGQEREIPSTKKQTGWKKPRILSVDSWPTVNGDVAESRQGDDANDPDARWLDGRRFSKNEKVKYILPTDKMESERMKLSHMFWKWVFHRYVCFPRPFSIRQLAPVA
ncbi:hypothetical protein BC938DRAFT_482693 [Jimgerdemannia flammicorona]|uniref:Uncharacterized protein n=1 Tax=Jimgerdemannia flammicorona TaxID=994334 RepID=A0A433QDK5_9FUNG|nr:hypothetical protein BC938DRAFT_482693 [Jimgerdemannia flammicorona]